MAKRPTNEELEKRIQQLEREAAEYKQSTEALKESEDRYRRLVEHSFDGIAIHRNGRIVFVNPAGAGLLGARGPEQLIGMSLMSFVHPDYRRTVEKRIRDVREEKGAVPLIEEKFLRLDKGVIDVEVLGISVIYQGEPAVQVVFRDITQRKRAEEELKENEKFIKDIFDSIQDGISILDTNMNIVLTNRTMERWYAHQLPLPGKKCYEACQGSAAPCDGCPCLKTLKNAEPAHAIMPLTGRTGSAGWHELFSYPLKDSKTGILLGVIQYVRDITDLKQAEEETVSRRKYLESILNSAPDAIVTLDASHTVVEWNPGAERMFGYSREEARGKDLDDLISRPQLLEEMKMLTRNILSGGLVLPHEAVRYRKDGAPVSVIASGAPILLGGELRGVVALYKDITDRKKAEEEKRKLEGQLLQAQKMEAIGKLAGGIAHDFNNLLMGIQGRTSLMMADLDGSHPYMDHLRGMEEYIRSAADLTKQLLGFARGGKYEVRATDLNKLVSNSASMFGRTKKEITIHAKLHSPLWTAEVDQRQIEQVLLNLFVNAWQAMPAGGTIYLQTENVILERDYVKPFGIPPGRFVKVSVTDTGTGMDEATLQRIFDPFFTTKGMGRGTGLGLASAYGIIKNHEGIITVYSEKGQGATFNIYLPASDKGVEGEKGQPEGLKTGTGTILLVDDEAIVIDVGRPMLERLGYQVLEATGGASALEIYEHRRKEIDLVILDMIMPDMGGGETFDRLRQINPEVKVLLSSGYSINGRAQMILNRGCSGFIQKPFTMHELSQKIGAILEQGSPSPDNGPRPDASG
ncbi:MAG: PAS domain S-box protein [Deltaproteobacteria bacterium]|nr:PAS domain S-box protein [Deltaproteobacteria bacterium]